MKSDKEWLVTLLLSLFLGTIGVLQLITLGGCGVWTLIDIIMIVTGNFKDKDGNVIQN